VQFSKYKHHNDMDKITTFTEYSKRAAETQMESCKNEEYLRLGLISEVGKLCAIFKRAIRGDFKLEDKRQDILLKLGNICWYLDRIEALKGLLFEWRHEWGISPNISMATDRLFESATDWLFELASDAAFNSPSAYCWNCVTLIAYLFGFSIWDVLNANVEKLAKRKELGLIQGSGDHRECDQESDAPYCGCDPNEV
jgi:hypothetical protein